MIKSAREFFELRNSDCLEDQKRASTEECSEDTWIEVLEKYPEMKEWVALNKTVSVKILRILSNDEDPNVRLTIALKRKIPTDIIDNLAKDSDPSVRHQIAHRKKLDINILKKLSKDPIEFVRKSALKKLKERL